MYNCTSKILSYRSPEHLVSGVVLPYSDTVLTTSDIDKKIETKLAQIAHLTQRISKGGTHGGKRLRAQRISLQEQIFLTSQRLKLLKLAKNSMPDHFQFIKKDLQFGGKQRIMTLVSRGREAETVGAVAIMPTEQLSIFDSPVFEAIDKEIVPPEVRTIISVVQSIKRELEGSLEDCVMLGDLYIYPEFRGCGYSSLLIQKVCLEIFSTTKIKCIAIAPDPFEYENKMQKSLQGTPEYEMKKERLIKLYQLNGFVLCQSESPVLYKKK